MHSPLFLSATAAIGIASLTTSVDAHGYLLSPVSRNWHAAEEGTWWCTENCDNLPAIEDCPHCMNRADEGAVCGVKQNNPSVNYDHPKNYHGDDLQWTTQETYGSAGQEIDIEFVITAHHRGHVEMAVCADTTNPTQDCFDQNPMTFVKDLKYGAEKDARHPERLYLAPTTVSGGLDQKNGGYQYQATMKLPDGVSGRALIQWRYYTGNSCIYDGYDSYAWPSSWGSADENLGGLSLCPYPLPIYYKAPERFWNCAEVEIGNGTGGSIPAPVPAPMAFPTQSPIMPPTNAPVPASGSEGRPTPAAPTPELVVEPIGRETPEPPSGDCCANAGADLLASQGCSGYTQCWNGVDYGFKPCPGGTKFNQERQICDWEDTVPNCVDAC